MPRTIRAKVVPRETLTAIVTSPAAQEIDQHTQDDMAIPSYLHDNLLVRWLIWRRYEVIASLLGEEVGRALEFGCGVGMFLPTLCSCAETVTAIDLVPVFARELVRIEGLEVDFMDSLEEIETASLDLIIAADVLEHFEDATEVVGTFHRLLAPGGRFIISGPTESGFYKLCRFLAGFSGKEDYHYSNIDRLAELISRSRLRRVRSRRLPLPVPPALFRVFEFEKVTS